MQKADKMFEKLGFWKSEESNFFVQYRKFIAEHSYVRCIEFYHKADGNHIVHSIEEGINSDGFSNSVGMTAPEVNAVRRKFKELRW